VQEQVNQFLRHLTDERDYSDNTIAAYRNDLHQFVTFLHQNAIGAFNSWADVDRQLAEAYGTHLLERAYASSTIARKVASVKSFFSFLLATEQLTDNPLTALNAPKVEKRVPRILSLEEVERLLSEPAKASTPKKLRDRALLELLYATGMRVSELLQLRLDDIDMAESCVSCIGRDGNTRKLPLAHSAATSLSKYLDKGRDALLRGQNESRLFVNQRGRPLTRQGLWLITKFYAQAAGLGPDVTPHTMRHSFAAHRLAQGNDLQRVREMLGHANISTTQVYVDIIHPADQESGVDLA
jgi:integrase/recombinase XerD